MHPTSFRFASAATARPDHAAHGAEFRVAFTNYGWLARCDPFLEAFEHEQCSGTGFDGLDFALGNGFIHARAAIAGIRAADAHGDMSRFNLMMSRHRNNP